MRAAACIGLLCVSVSAARAQTPTSHALIQIGVEVVEVNEQKAANLGIQWLSQLHVRETSIPSFFKVGTLARDTIFADLQLLEQAGAAHLLANPKLVARHGATATFHAGGEIPYATAAAQGSVTVEFKSYGVNLKVSPRVSGELIDLTVEAEVSGPDTQNSVSLSGNAVPGIRSRKASSEVTLFPGSTLTMAGLLQNDKEWSRAGVPFLMHVPLLKYLVSRKVETRRKTSVVIFVTPTFIETPKPPIAFKQPEPEDGLLQIEQAKDMGIIRG